jgi:hypothetical protein
VLHGPRPEPVDRDGPLLGDDLGRSLPGLEILAEARLTSTDTDGHDTGIIETTAIAAQDQHARITPGHHLHHASGRDPVTWTRMLNTPGNLAAIMVVPAAAVSSRTGTRRDRSPGLVPAAGSLHRTTHPSVPACRPATNRSRSGARCSTNDPPGVGRAVAGEVPFTPGIIALELDAEVTSDGQA